MDIEEVKRRIVQEINFLTLQRDNVSNDIIALESEIAQLQEEIGFLSAYSELEDRMTRLKVKLAEKQSELEMKKREYEEFEKKIKSSSDDLAAIALVQKSKAGEANGT